MLRKIIAISFLTALCAGLNLCGCSKNNSNVKNDLSKANEIAKSPEAIQDTCTPTNRNIENTDTVFVRLSQVFSSEAQAQDYLNSLKNEKRLSLKTSFCKYGIQIIPSKTFLKVSNSQNVDSLKTTTMYKYVKLSLCFDNEDAAKSFTSSENASYKGFDDLSQCYNSAMNEVYLKDTVQSIIDKIAAKGLKPYLQIFAGDYYIILGLGINETELMGINSLSKELNLSTVVFRDNLTSGD